MRVQVFKRLSLVMLAILLCAAVAVAVFLPTTAQAYTQGTITSGTGLTKIGEIFNDNATTGGTFDKTNLQALIKALGATEGANLEATVANLGTSVDNSTTTLGSGSYSSFSDTMRINDKNIIVEFGGITWFAAFLSLSDTTLDNSTYSGIGNVPTTNASTGAGTRDVILTLWQAVPNTGSERSATWSDTTLDAQYGTDKQNSDVNYPSNMYGTSIIRAVTLNNGGTYSRNATTTTTASQSATNTYAKFTMEYYGAGSSNKSNIHSFLVAPRYISWQKAQVIPSDWGWTEKGKALNNQAWGTMGKNNYYNNAVNYPYYEEKNNYTQWKEDLVWLPSCTEVGNYWSNNEQKGLWNLSQEQRKYADGGSTDALWLRTGIILITTMPLA